MEIPVDGREVGDGGFCTRVQGVWTSPCIGVLLSLTSMGTLKALDNGWPADVGKL